MHSRKQEVQEAKGVMSGLAFFFFPSSFFETGSRYVAQAGLELLIILPQSPACWDYGRIPPFEELFCKFYPITSFYISLKIFLHPRETRVYQFKGTFMYNLYIIEFRF
jgi:hypothetical protein